jgi:hypothetical protein
VEFAISENSNSLKRPIIIILICVMNDCRPVGDSVVDSAEFQCDMNLRHTTITWMNNCPHEIFSELKGVDFELGKVIVEGEARQGSLFI